MNRLLRMTHRQWLIVLHDLLVTAAALVVTLFIRFQDIPNWPGTWNGCRHLLAGFLPYAFVVYFLLGLHEHKWRFTSMPELSLIVQASAVLAVSLLVLRLHPEFHRRSYGTFFFGKITIAVYFVTQTRGSLGATRIGYRSLARRARRNGVPPADINSIPAP